MAEAAEPATASPQGWLYHVGRKEDPLSFSYIDPIAAELADVGNRFDVVGGGVLYASTEPIGAYKETIAFARPAASAAKFEPTSGEHFMNAGNLPADWRDRRRMATFQLEQELPFLDVEQDETLTYLTRAMAVELDQLKVKNLDVATVRGSNRLVTRAIASFVWTAVDDQDEARYSGIRYLSRFQSHECWAIFAGVTIGNTSYGTIERSDTFLSAAARDFGVTVH
jgi:hypothetical protein